MKKKEWATLLVQLREPATIPNVLGFLDGVTFYSKCAEDAESQAVDNNIVVFVVLMASSQYSQKHVRQMKSDHRV